LTPDMLAGNLLTNFLMPEGMMALTVDRPDSYVLRDLYTLPEHVQVEKFTEAWDMVARNNPILRTRLIFIQGLGTCQVVVNEQLSWHHADDLDDYLLKDRNHPMDYGTGLARFAIIDDGKRKVFVWTVHHSLYDGYSMDMTLAAVEHAYQGTSDVLPTRPFSEFMVHLDKSDRETLRQYWTHQLRDLETSPFPLSPPGHRCQADSTVVYSVPFSLDRMCGITMATLLKAGWAILISRLSESSDVVYGVTQSGRDLELPGIETINGPTITTVSALLLLHRVLHQKRCLTSYVPGAFEGQGGGAGVCPRFPEATADPGRGHDPFLPCGTPGH